MKKKVLSFCVVALALLSTNKVKSQTDTDFWFVVPEITVNHGYPGGIPANLVFSTSNFPATIVVSMPANPIQFPDIVINIVPNSTYKLDLSSWINTSSTEQNKIENKALNASGINNFGIHITSTTSITAYYEINNSWNTDIWVLKGRNALGTDFYTPFQTHGANGSYGAPDATALPYSAIDIVATEDNTTIEVTPSKNASYGNAGEAITANTPKTFILNKGQTLSIFPENKSQVAANRLAGSHITSDKPIAITLKDDSIIHPSGGCRDVVGDQLIPVNLTGADHVVMRTFLNANDYIYVVATQNSTPIYVDNVLVATLNAGQQYQIVFPTTYATSYIKVSSRLLATDPYKPIYVFHIGGFGCEQGGAIIPTIDICTGSTQVAFARSNPNPFYLTIMVRDGAQDGFLVNGETRNDLLPPAAFVLVPGTSWRVARLGNFSTTQFKIGQHLILNTKDFFHLGIINGNAGTTCMYGYFSSFNKFKADAFVVSTGGPLAMLCNGDSVQLSASGGVSYKWTPTDFLNDPSINAPIARNVTYSIKYKVVLSGACGLKDSAEVSLQVAPYIEANFTVDTISGKAPLTVKITNNSINAYQSLWDFNGDGDMLDPGDGLNNSKTLTHTFENNTNEDIINNITLIISDPSSNCFKTTKRSITVKPKFKVDFVVDKYSDCSPSTFNFTNATSSQAKTFEWDLNNDGTIDFITKEIPSQLFTNTSNDLQVREIPIKLTATDSTGFKNSVIKTIRIYPNPTASIAIDNNGNALGCSPLSLNLSSTSTNATIFDWKINGNSFDNQTNASCIFTNSNLSPITRIITLKTSNIYGCSDSMATSITVQPSIKASFIVDKIEGCSPLVVNVLNDSRGSISQYIWDRDGDGEDDYIGEGSGSLININNSSTNTQKIIPIRLKVKNAAGCVDELTNSITVYPQPTCSIVLNNNGNSLGCSPLSVDFSASTTNSNIFKWEIDGNAFSNNTTASYTFNNFGTNAENRTVSFTASNQYGCSSSQSNNILVQPFVESQFIVDKYEGCSPLTSIFANISSSGSNFFKWYIDESLLYTTQNIPDQIFSNQNDIPLIIPVKLESSNAAGCKDISIKTITVYPTPIVDLGANQHTCEDSPITLDAKNPGANYLWSTNETSRTITVSTDGFYSVVVTNPYFCSNTDEVSITVNPNPIVNIGPDTIKTPLPYPLHSNIENVSYLWNTGETTPSIIVNSYGVYNLTVTDSLGCTASDTTTIMVSMSVDNNKLNAQVQLYPNPAKDKINIAIDAKNPDAFKIELVDPLSRVVKNLKSQETKQFKTTINIQDLNSGIYILRVSGKKGTNSYKVIIQK